MRYKVHWIIDGIADLDTDSAEAAEAAVEAMIKELIGNQPELLDRLGAKAIQGKAYLPGSQDDPDAA